MSNARFLLSHIDEGQGLRASSKNNKTETLVELTICIQEVRKL